MTTFDPPFSKRSNDELIQISYSSTDDWQQTAIDKAIEELANRGIGLDERKKRNLFLIEQAEQKWENELLKRKVEDYSLFDKIIMILFWYKEIFHNWYLYRNGYVLKWKRRFQLIGLGFTLYLIFIIYSMSNYSDSQQKRLDKIEAIDITEWEEN